MTMVRMAMAESRHLVYIRQMEPEEPFYYKAVLENFRQSIHNKIQGRPRIDYPRQSFRL